MNIPTTRPNRRIASIIGPKLIQLPVPTNKKSNELISYGQSQPFIDTLKMTFSLQMSSGFSSNEGVKHLIVVEFTQRPIVSPKRPNLHLMVLPRIRLDACSEASSLLDDQRSNLPASVGNGSKNKLLGPACFLSIETTTSVMYPTSTYCGWIFVIFGTLQYLKRWWV